MTPEHHRILAHSEGWQPVCDVLVSRLMSLFDPQTFFHWIHNDRPITVADVVAARGFVAPVTEPHVDIGWKGLPREWHIGRVIHLLGHEDVDPITLQSKRPGHLDVIDGNHRLLSRLVRGDQVVPVRYAGRRELLQYLTGARDAYEPAGIYASKERA